MPIVGRVTFATMTSIYNCNTANNSNSSRIEFRQLISYRATQNPHFPLPSYFRPSAK